MENGLLFFYFLLTVNTMIFIIYLDYSLYVKLTHLATLSHPCFKNILEFSAQGC